jgi:YggT family protein
MLLFDAIGTAQTFVAVFVDVYALVFVLFILTSWLRLPYSLNPVRTFLSDVCEPYLRLWRRILPLSFGAFDFTPIIAILGLYLVGRLVVWGLGRFH